MMRIKTRVTQLAWLKLNNVAKDIKHYYYGPNNPTTGFVGDPSFSSLLPRR